MTPARRIIAFDLGSTFAYAVNATPLITGRIEFPKKMIREHRLARLQRWLRDELRLYELDLAIYERPFCRGIHATRSLWGMAGVIEAVCTNHGLPVLDVPPASIKKWATGRGHAVKGNMIAAAQVMGYDGENEHEADAVCLMRFAEHNVEPGEN